MTLPSIHAFATIVLTIGTFWLFAKGTIRIELVSLLVIGILALGFYFFPFEHEGAFTGMEVAFGGFGHEALIAICCLMILGRGLVVTGALQPAGRLLGRLWQLNKPLGLLFSLIIGAGMSMVVNDTPVLVLTMPILLNLAVRADVPASRTLMPMNCAILIGGMATTIGTSTNLLVVSIASDLGLPEMGVFHYTDTVLIAAAIALPYLWLVMPRLLPKHSTQPEQSDRVFDASLFVVAGSALVGLSQEDAARKLAKGITLSSVSRPSTRSEALGDGGPLRIGDALLVEGVMAQLMDASDDLKAPLVHPSVMEAVQAFESKPHEHHIIAEMVVGSDSPLIGETIKSAQIADRYGVAIAGLHRPNKTFFSHPDHSMDIQLALGDVLLILGRPEGIKALELAESAMVLEGAAEMPLNGKASAALAITAAVVLLASLKLMPISLAALGGAIAMLATGCIKFHRLGRALSTEVIVLVAASIAMGRALLETGAAGWLGEILAFGLGGLPPAAILAAMMLFATLLTNFASNTAAAAVSTPIAVSLAHNAGIPTEPLVLAVLFGCNLCYATPFAYQTNILIMSAGGYTFRDYLRAGLPLVAIMIVSLSILLVMRYDL